jgi:hypothetical protein
METAGEGLPLYRRTCQWCKATFGVCESDHRGQRYCKEDCRYLAQLALARLRATS